MVNRPLYKNKCTEKHIFTTRKAVERGEVREVVCLNFFPPASLIFLHHQAVVVVVVKTQLYFSKRQQSQHFIFQKNIISTEEYLIAYMNCSFDFGEEH